MIEIGGFFLFNNLHSHNHSKELTQENYPKIYDNLNSITVDTFKQKIKNKEDLIVYVGRPSCIDCSFFENSFIDYLKNNSVRNKIFYLNISPIYEKKAEWDIFKEKYNIKHTPTFAKFENGKLYTKIEWSKEKGLTLECVKKWINKNITNGK